MRTGAAKAPGAGPFLAARAVVSLTAAVALVSVLLTARGVSVDARSPYGLLVPAWSLGPLVYYWFRVAAVAGAWLAGTALGARLTQLAGLRVWGSRAVVPASRGL